MTPSTLARSFRRFLTPSLLAVAVACGGPNFQGNYTNANGLATLDITSSDAAAFNVMGQRYQCTYKVEATKFTLTCPGEDPFQFTVGQDGSLTSVGTFIGTMTKKKP